MRSPDAALAGAAPLFEPERLALLQSLLGETACRELGIYALPEGFKLSVVIPVYNEHDTVVDVVAQVRGSGVDCEIILVDDGSSDGTGELLEKWRRDEAQNDLVVVFHETNRGKGAAVRTGLARATGDAVIVQDADLEYDPAEYKRLLAPIIFDEADVVFGSRFQAGSHRVLYFWHYVGNRLLTTLSNLFTNLNLTDMETCYKVFRRDAIERIAPRLRENRFGIEPELTALAARLPGVRIFEVPISYRGRTYAEGKKITWKDGLAAIWCILRCGLTRSISSRRG